MSWHESEQCRHIDMQRRTARKEHRCDGCRHTIHLKEEYLHFSCISAEGDRFAIKMHPECYDWYDALCIFFDYFGAGLAFDASIEALQEMGGEADVSDAYRVYADLWWRLNALCKEGRGESSEADALRDASDEPWHKMTGHDHAVFERFVRRLEEGRRGAP